MTRPDRLRTGIGARLLALGLGGCVAYRPVDGVAANRTAAAPEELEAARSLAGSASDEPSLSRAIEAWTRVVEVAPGRAEAWAARADLMLLKGAAYAETRGEQREYYRRAMEDAERAMWSNERFRSRRRQGQTAWEAAEALDEGSMDAMMIWATAVFYQYRDCMGTVRRILSYRWLGRAEAMLRRMEAIDPEWGGGVLRFSWAIYHFALPEMVGGDRELAARQFGEAIEMDPSALLFRWGRGRYFHLETGDRAGFEADLRWVESRTVEPGDERYPWAVYFQREARELLAESDRLFPD